MFQEGKNAHQCRLEQIDPAEFAHEWDRIKQIHASCKYPTRVHSGPSTSRQVDVEGDVQPTSFLGKAAKFLGNFFGQHRPSPPPTAPTPRMSDRILMGMSDSDDGSADS